MTLPEIIHDQTPVSQIVNSLNRRCVDHAKRQEWDESRRMASLAGRLEEAVTEFHNHETELRAGRERHAGVVTDFPDYKIINGKTTIADLLNRSGRRCSPILPQAMTDGLSHLPQDWFVFFHPETGSLTAAPF